MLDGELMLAEAAMGMLETGTLALVNCDIVPELLVSQAVPLRSMVIAVGASSPPPK